MSGLFKCYHDYYKAGRDHIRKLTGRSKDARKMTNSELACELYDVILQENLKDRHATVLMEAAERLDTFRLECIERAREN